MTEKHGIEKFLETYDNENITELITNAILMNALEIPIEMVITETEAERLSQELKHERYYNR